MFCNTLCKLLWRHENVQSAKTARGGGHRRAYLMAKKEGARMITLYYWPTPNGHKITIFLEEAGVAYRIEPVNIGQGDQFRPEFLAISPNNRMPAIVDDAPEDGGNPISVFESGTISCISPRKPKNSSRRMSADASACWNGCSGKWAGSGRWPDRTTISRATPPKKFPTRLIDM